jgi:hypothetical protein
MQFEVSAVLFNTFIFLTFVLLAFSILLTKNFYFECETTETTSGARLNRFLLL